MTESFWLQVANLAVTALLSAFVWWLRYTHKKSMEEHDVLDIMVAGKVDAAATQIGNQYQKLESIHEDINGKVAQLMSITVKHAISEERARVAAELRDSMPKAIDDALEAERERVANTIKDKK